MKIAIIGAGAMGCLYASMLSKNNQVTLYDANEKTVQAINNNGVTIIEKDNSKKVYKIPCKLSGDCDEAVDLVIVFVKSTVSEIAIASNKNLIDKNTILLSLQNGMGNIESLKKFADDNHVLLGTSKHNAVVISFGEIFHSGSGVTVIGSPINYLPHVEKVADCLIESNIETDKSQCVNHLLWEKLFVNLTINPITALFEEKIGLVAESEGAKALLVNLLQEAISVAKADGENFEFESVYNVIESVSEKLSSGTASMCQDILNGRKTEIDFINGAVCRIGKKYNIPTPYNDNITRLIHIKEFTKTKNS